MTTLTSDTTPIAVTLPNASRMSGLGLTTLWAYLKDGRLEPIRPPGVRRTLISVRSLRALLTPEPQPAQPPKRRRGRPRKSAPVTQPGAP